MGWLLLLIGIVVLFWLASLGRKAKQREVIRSMRRDFPRIARLRLMSACPGLDGVLEETELRMVFDWMLLRMYQVTGAGNFGELMQWFIDNGNLRGEEMVADVTREAIERLPRPVLAAIDACQGREFAAVVLDQSLTEAGERTSAGVKRG